MKQPLALGGSLQGLLIELDSLTTPALAASSVAAAIQLEQNLWYGFGVMQSILVMFLCCFSDPFVRRGWGVMLSGLDMSPLIPCIEGE